QRSNMTVSGNRITNNTASGRGGAIHIFNVDGDGAISGNFFGFNNASGGGSAIYAHLRPDKSRFFVLPLLDIPDQLIPLILGLEDEPAAIRMDHNTFAHNQGGSTVLFYGEGRGFMVNNIVAFNSGTAIRAESEILPFILLIAPIPFIGVLPIPYVVPYIPIINMDTTLWYPSASAGGSLGGAVNQTASVTGDPHFMDDGYHIKRISAAFGAGKNSGGGPDLDGDGRPTGNFADMGADEYVPATTVRYLAPDGGDGGGEFCRNYENPCSNLQVAIDMALDGDIIKMAGGTYAGGHTTRDGQVQMGYITKTVTIQGGYYPFTTDNDVTEGVYTDHDWEVPFPDLNPTILDAEDGGRVLYIFDPERVDQEGNPIEVRPVISGIQMRNGNAAGLRGPEANTFPAGGGVYVDKAQAVLDDVTISESSANYGGGLYILESEVDLNDVQLRENSATHRGGGLYLDNSDDIMFQGMLIEDNVAPRGGGVYIFASDAFLELNQIRNNGGPNTEAGGGIYLEASATNIISHTITGNQANQGGGVYVDTGEPQFVGNTVANNTAFPTNPPGRGGGFYFAASGGQMAQNVIEQNQADDGGGIYLDQAEVQVVGNEITANVATRAGGGVYFLSTNDARVAENQITQNRANGTGENDGGGGLYYESSRAGSAQNQILNNSAFAGGGIYLFSFSNAPLEENTIATNSANGDGGGVYVKLSNATLLENIITGNNTVVGSGGGVYVKLSGAQLNSNTIHDNRATLFGGGVYLDESGASLRGGSLENNQARDGGGLYIFRSNTATFETVGIRSNVAENNGGGVFIRLSNVPFEGQMIEENQAGLLGGGAYLDESNSTFGRNLVRANSAGESGGGVAITNRSNANLSSNAIIDNQAGATGSGVFVGGASPALVHTTLARNRGGDGTGVAAESRAGVASTVALVNTIFAGQDLGVRAGSGNTVTLEATLWDNSVQTRFTPGQGVIVPGPADSNFAGAVNFEADGYHIQRTSLALGLGIFTEVTRDIDGQGRPQGGAPDLGADELPAECLAVVSTDLEQVYTEVQEAINAADPGAEVRISGTCVGVGSQDGTTQLAYVNKNITLRGGYTPTNWLVSYPITQPTFLDALGDGRVLFVGQNVNPTIEDLNLLGGSASGQGGGPSALDAGGVIYARNASPTLRRLTVGGGTAYYGGGLYLQNSQATVSDSVFDGHNGTKGGAVFLRNSTATLRDNLIRAGAAEDGGGVFLSFSQSLLENNQIVQNAATGAGGGLFLESSPATLRANVVATNTAEAAGGIYVDGSSPQLVRNSFTDNEAQNGGGVYLLGTNGVVNGNQILRNSAGIGAGVYIQGGEPNFANNVVAQNLAQVQAAGIYVLSASLPMRHNTIVANTGGDGTGLFVTDLGTEPSQIDFVNNILAEHTVGITLTAGNRVDLAHTLYDQNAANFGGSGIAEEGAGNFSASPQFADGPGGDYHLAGNSPAVDAGTDAGIADDLDGQSRPADNGFDIGADEFVVLGLRMTVQTIPDPVVAGQDVTFVIRAVNLGNVDLDATIVAELPDAVIPSGLFTFTANIPAGQAWTESIFARARPDFTGAMEIVVTATTENGLSEVVSVTAQAERADYALQLTVEPVPNPAPKGGQLRYRINLANQGNLAVNPTLRAQLSPQVSYDGALEWSAAQLTPGSAWARNVDVLVAPDATGTVTATFRATSPEGATANVTVEVPVAEPGLVVRRTITPNPPQAGRIVTYTVFVTNTGNVDFTTTITNFMPEDETGRPLVAPGGPIVFEDVTILRGERWIQQIVGVIEPGYVGPLAGSTVARTDSGLVFVY
ncbi:MAG: right-handed parallel beta-helix repeat-containing protein, partial [Litorilinea sp.]